MVAPQKLSDHERPARMMHFNLLHGFQLGLYAAGLFSAGDAAVRRNSHDVEHADFSDVFSPDPDDEVKVLT